MARLGYVDPEDASGDTAALYDGINATIGRVSNFMRLMGHAPWLLRWTFPLGVAAQREGFARTPVALRNLAIVKTSLCFNCTY